MGATKLVVQGALEDVTGWGVGRPRKTPAAWGPLTVSRRVSRKRGAQVRSDPSLWLPSQEAPGTPSQDWT